MKAAVIYENGGPDVLRYEDVPDPDCPDGCVLIDVEAISIEGGDLACDLGARAPRASEGQRQPRQDGLLPPRPPGPISRSRTMSP